MLAMWLLLSNRKVSETLCTYSSVECVKVIKPQDLTTAESVTGSICEVFFFVLFWVFLTTNYTHSIGNKSSI